MAVIEIHSNYIDLGINSRSITDGDEYKMVSNFIEYRKESFKEKPDNHLAVFLETKINNAYPDVVFAEYNPFMYEEWNDARNSLSLFDMKVLHYIYTCQNVTSSKIIKSLSYKYRDLLSALEKLLDADLIIRKNGKWAMQRKNVFGVKKVEAIEAKISNWDKVMQQALLNKTFASESCILSKKKTKPSSDIISQMTDLGIGIYIYNDIDFLKISSAKKRKFPINYNSIYINECIGRVLHYN